jgi:hypothetical protein
MPNIFKRPMFRKGGSTSEGTGITSGLTPRQNYQDQGNVQKKEPYEILIENQYQKMLPSQADSIRNYITGFGASASKDPMALQTFGSAFGQASKIGAGLNAQQIAQAEKFRTQAGIQAVKNLTKDDRDILEKRAALVAKQRNIPYNDALGLVLDNFMKENSPFLKGDSPQIRMRKAEKDYIVEGLYSELEAENLAKFKIDRQDNKIPSDLRAKLDVSNFILNPDIVIVDPKTGIGIFKTGIRDNKKDDYRPGRAYVAPADGKIYIYDGTKFVKAPGY